MIILFSTRENIIYRRAGAKLFHIRRRAKLIPIRTHAVTGAIHARGLGKAYIVCVRNKKRFTRTRIMLYI